MTVIMLICADQFSNFVICKSKAQVKSEIKNRKSQMSYFFTPFVSLPF